MARASHSRNVVALNRKARRNYDIEETLEAGVALTGTEVKALRAGGGCSINEAYAGDRDGDFYLVNAYIPRYRPAGPFNHEPRRERRLLLRRREINRLIGSVTRAGVTVVPLAIYFNARGLAKVELGLARGRKKADKRAVEKEREWRRQKARLLREKG